VAHYVLQIIRIHTTSDADFIVQDLIKVCAKQVHVPCQELAPSHIPPCRQELITNRALICANV
jgi:hypothetical protein